MLKKLLLLIIVVGFVGVIGIAWFFQNTAAPASSNKTVSFIIAKGASGNQIANNLYKEGLIKNPLVFRLYIRAIGIAGKIPEGEYDLPTNNSLFNLVGKILKGPTEVWVTIPEGLRREEVTVKFIQSFGLTADAANNFYQQFLKLTQNREGYLFPDTYLFAKTSTPELVDKTMEDNFTKKYAEAIKVQTVNLTEKQAVILASIVQREAITASDMQGVASVLENRLNIGMPLGSDVTLEYALGYQADTKNWWKQDLTIDDLAKNTQYNTRLYAGLPPTPISSPGLVAIEAVLNPPKTDYLYYLSDSDGKLHFAKTLAEHNANIKKYLGR